VFGVLKILDCACGIGTQALGLAAFGHQVIASDLSQAEVNRAKHEAQIRALDISFHASDMTSLAEIADRDFDVVAALDNALPHLTADQLSRAVEAVGSKLKSNGLFIASIRFLIHPGHGWHSLALPIHCKTISKKCAMVCQKVPHSPRLEGRRQARPRKGGRRAFRGRYETQRQG
jgi:2-polyprenyl-3-methyl-5-hydroxy-6-metoxy-1,4-benzoquinol methylase